MGQNLATDVVSYPFLLNGEWISEGQPAEIHSPYDHSLVGHVFYANRKHVEAAIRAAVQAFAITRKLGSYQRQQILTTISNTIASRREEFSRTIALEAGKPIKTARQEVDRYTFRAPGQATSYFYGYTKLMELRAETEITLGKKFNRLAFNDFVVGQGLLPPALLREAVKSDFIPAQMGK